ncbi:MAG: hypothetical protein ACRDIC_17965 [bacterium]
MRTIRLGLVAVALLLTGYNGLVEGVNATHYADTLGMKLATATQLGYGITALAALAAWALRPRAVLRILVVWGHAVVATGLLAPVVYAGHSVPYGIAIGSVTALVVTLVLFAWPRVAATAA